MAIAYVNGSSTADSTAATTFTHTTHSLTGGANSFLVVTISAIASTESAREIYECRLGERVFSSAVIATTTTTSRRYCADVLVLPNPPSGANTITVIYSATMQGCVIGCMEFSGAFTGKIGATATNTAGCNPSITTTRGNSMVVTAATVRSNTTPPTFSPAGSGGAEVYELNTGSASTEVVGGGYYHTTTTAGAYTVGATTADTTGDIAAAVEIFEDYGDLDVTYRNSNVATTATSCTVTSTASGSNRLAIITVTTDDATGADRAVNTVTYDGASCTKVNAIDAQERSELWYIIAPSTTASANVVVTCGGTVDKIIVGVICFANADQTAPIEANSSLAAGSSTTATMSVTTASANAWVVSTIASAAQGDLYYATEGLSVIGEEESGTTTYLYSQLSGPHAASTAVTHKLYLHASAARNGVIVSIKAGAVVASSFIPIIRWF